MKPWIRTVRDERGVALPLALFALLMLSGLLLAFLSMSGMESEISANLSDVARARYLADAGIEVAFDQLVTNTAWNNVLLGADNNPNTADDGVLVIPALVAPLNNAAFGTFTVRVRNDNQATDPPLTGLPIDGGGATNDTNGAVIVTATGTYRGISRQIQVVLRRVNLPPFPGSYTVPGAQADLSFSNANFTIDGRDYVYKCTANCSDSNPLNRTYTYSQNADQSKMKYGIATGVGNQFNTGTSYESRAEINLNTAAKQARVMGKSQVGGGFTTGLNTVAPDASMGALVTLPDGTADSPQTPKAMNDFLTQLAAFQSTTIYQAKLACAVNVGGLPVGMRMIANSDPKKANLVTIQDSGGAGCLGSKQIDLGTVDKPALVYFRGDLDPTSAFAGVRTENNGGQQKVRGAGILVVEDGDLRVTNQFDWDGVVIVTGRYVSSIFESGANVNIYGASVANETKKCEGGGGACGASTGTLWDGSFASSNTVNLFFSQQNLDLVQRKLLFRMSTWREL